MRSLHRVAFLAALTITVGCGGSSASVLPVTPPPVYVPATVAGADRATDAKIRQSLSGPQRTDAERARDGYRHPLETLEFFGLKDDMTVIELSPGGGWYSAVLAPVLRDNGKLFVAGGDPNGDPKTEGTRDAQALLARFQKTPGAFDKVQSVVVARSAPPVLGPAESADMVVTFRNFHNWVGGHSAEPILGAVFAVLKHGGVLGLTDHRANPAASPDARVVDDTGYIPEDAVVQIVEKAGFKLAGKSEANANPRDTKDYPKGVWTLPPTYELGDKDRAKYTAIGESDRMTLRFVKP